MITDIDITRKQSDFIQSKSELTIYRGGIGAGKTFVLCLIAILTALEGKSFLLISFSYPTLRDVCLEMLVELLHKMKINYKLNAQFLNLRIGSGIIRLRSGDNPDRLRGINCDRWGIDEAREFKTRDIYDIAIGRARKSEDGRGYISTTTKGKNWVYELESVNGCQTVTQTTLENPFLPESYKRKLIEQYSSNFARQEIYAEIVEMSAGVINPTWFKTVYTLPEAMYFRFWDLAVSTKTHADFSAGAKLCIDSEEDIYLSDLKRVKIEYPDLRELIIKTAIEDGPDVPIGVEDAGQQIGFIQDIMREPRLRGFQIKAIKPTGDKFNRCMPWASKAEAGKFYIYGAGWNANFKDECSSFSPNNSHLHDDQVDAVSGAFSMVANIPIYQTRRYKL